MLIQSLIFLILGFVLLVKGADWFVDSAVAIARKFSIPELVIGLTIVAMGTSMPEAAVSINAALNGNAGIAIGNVCGSNIMNILVVLGLTAIVATIPVQKSTVKTEIPFLLVISLFVLIFGKNSETISRIEGAILWGCFILYLTHLFRISKNKETGTEEKDPKIDRPVWQCIGILIITGIMIVKGSDLIVSGASNIASLIGLSDRIIGLTVVAFGTSLPELVTCITAATKGKTDLAIGNIVGSNIFNILFVLGTTAVIAPVPFETKFVVDAAVGIFAAFVLWLGVFRKNQLGRAAGIIMLGIYAVYFVQLL